MNPALATATIITLAVLLALVSAVLGVLWCRVRAVPSSRSEILAEELAGRVREIDAALARLEAVVERASALKGKTPVSSRLFPNGPAACWRGDPPSGPAVPEPTLIAVPDLAASAVEAEDGAAAELIERYGPIWELADTGASPEAIARSTGQPIGQVELILGLRRQLNNTLT